MSDRIPKPPRALVQWSNLPVDKESTATIRLRRERIVQSIARTMQETRSRRWALPRRTARFAVAVAMAAGLVAGVAFWRTRMPTEPIVGRLYTLLGASHALVNGRVLPPAAPSAALSLAPQAEVETERASSSRLQLLSGVSVAVGPETHLRLPDVGNALNGREELALEAGFVRVQVPKLASGHFFAIRTPDTLVTVHGTSFSVEVTKPTPSAFPRTRVVVTEGVVSVQQGGSEILLNAGSEWRSAEKPPSAPRSAAAPSSISRPQAPGRPSTSARPSRATDTTASETLPTPTELAEQNRLFTDAMSARDRGDRAEAIHMLNEFIERYPGAPLAQDAHVARFRVLAAMGSRAAAAQAAGTYLTLYRNGFARQEAQGLASASPSTP